jgi:hypothetical protein
MSSVSTGVEPIIEARKLEKFYPQPDGGRIQVIAPIILNCCGARGSRFCA